MITTQETPDKSAKMYDGIVVTPLATFSVGKNGKAHVIASKDCYVIIDCLGNDDCYMQPYWFKEAINAVKLLIDKENK